MSYFRVNDLCNGCLACVQNCPASALEYTDYKNRRKIRHNITRCARCGHCWRVCPEKAIQFEHLLTGEWDDVISLNLIPCSVCGEPLYTSKFREALGKKSAETIEMVCPSHKKSLQINTWKHKLPKRKKTETVKK